MGFLLLPPHTFPVRLYPSKSKYTVLTHVLCSRSSLSKYCLCPFLVQGCGERAWPRRCCILQLHRRVISVWLRGKERKHFKSIMVWLAEFSSGDCCFHLHETFSWLETSTSLHVKYWCTPYSHMYTCPHTWLPIHTHWTFAHKWTLYIFIFYFIPINLTQSV